MHPINYTFFMQFCGSSRWIIHYFILVGLPVSCNGWCPPDWWVHASEASIICIKPEGVAEWVQAEGFVVTATKGGWSDRHFVLYVLTVWQAMLETNDEMKQILILNCIYAEHIMGNVQGWAKKKQLSWVNSAWISEICRFAVYRLVSLSGSS